MSAYLPWTEDLYSDYFTGKTVKLMLLGRDPNTLNLYSHNPSYANRFDVQNFEVSGTGYIAGGLTVANLTVIAIPAEGRVQITFDDVAYGTLTLDNDEIIAAVLYVDTGNVATDTLLAADVFDDVVTLAGTDSFTYAVAAAGFISAEI